MAKQIVQEIIMKAQKDETFMKELLEHPEKTLSSYSLTAKEIDFFKQSDEKTLRGLSPACFELAGQ